LLASYLTGAFCVAATGAWYVLRKEYHAESRIMLRMGLGLAAVSATHAVHLVLLKGTANEIKVDVAPALLVVKVDGTHHANKKDNVDYIAPLVTITPPGQPAITILPDQVTGPNGIDIQIPPGAADAGQGMLQVGIKWPAYGELHGRRWWRRHRRGCRAAVRRPRLLEDDRLSPRLDPARDRRY